MRKSGAERWGRRMRWPRSVRRFTLRDQFGSSGRCPIRRNSPTPISALLVLPWTRTANAPSGDPTSQPTPAPTPPQPSPTNQPANQPIRAPIIFTVSTLGYIDSWSYFHLLTWFEHEHYFISVWNSHSIWFGKGSDCLIWRDMFSCT